MAFINRFLLLILSFSVIIPNISEAQKLLISPSEIDESGFGYTKVIGQDDEGYFLLLSNITLNYSGDRMGFRSRKYKLAYYNSNLTQKWSIPVNATKPNAEIEAVTFFNESILIISSEYIKSDLKLNYYFSTINKEGVISGGENSVASFSQISGEYEKCRPVISTGRKMIAITTREFTSDNQQKLFAAIFDSELKPVKSVTGIANYAEKNFDLINFSLTDRGDLGILGIHSEKIKALSSKRTTDYLLFTASVSESQIKETAIAADRIITGLGLAADNINDQFVIAGFYSDVNSTTGSGVVYGKLTLDSTANFDLKLKPIDGEKNIRLKGERNAASGMSLIGYPIERIILRKDGGAVIVAEAAYTTEYSYYDYFTQSFTRREEFHFDNIAVLSVNYDASVQWSAIAEKEQVSIDDDGVFSSFCSLLNSEEMIVLFNDNLSRQNALIPVKISNTGAALRGKPVQGSEGLMILPRSAKQVAENEILVPAIKKRKRYLALITF